MEGRCPHRPRRKTHPSLHRLETAGEGTRPPSVARRIPCPLNWDKTKRASAALFRPASVMQLPHLRPYAKNPLYFLTVCTDGRRPVLADPHTSELLKTIWLRSAEHDGWFVGRYLIMPDHVHLFARPARDALACSEWHKSWKSISARGIARFASVSPPVWQRGYCDHFVRSAASYAEKWEYVRHNPVRAGLVQLPEDWPWQGVIHDLRY